jgi:hypothetical protein
MPGILLLPGKPDFTNFGVYLTFLAKANSGGNHGFEAGGD